MPHNDPEAFKTFKNTTGRIFVIKNQGEVDDILIPSVIEILFASKIILLPQVIKKAFREGLATMEDQEVFEAKIREYAAACWRTCEAMHMLMLGQKKQQQLRYFIVSFQQT